MGLASLYFGDTNFQPHGHTFFDTHTNVYAYPYSHPHTHFY